MKKSGFSLAELLVALSIIAIGASLMVPIALDARPDRYKFRVINCYNLASEATDRLLSNPELYGEGCNGLNCNNNSWSYTSNSTGINIPSGTIPNCIYPLLMKELLQIGTSATTCTEGKLEGNTKDGTTWNFTGDPTNGYNITITFPRSRFEQSNNCLFSDTCTNPNRFGFRVSRRGDITGSDRKTQAYLNNMINIRKSDD